MKVTNKYIIYKQNLNGISFYCQYLIIKRVSRIHFLSRLYIRILVTFGAYVVLLFNVKDQSEQTNAPIVSSLKTVGERNLCLSG